MLVLGGGNVAIDTAMTAVRLGAAWVGMTCLEGRAANAGARLGSARSGRRGHPGLPGAHVQGGHQAEMVR